MINVPLAAEPIFHIGTFAFTNALLNAVILMIGLVGVSIVVHRRIQEIPKGFQNMLEGCIEVMLGYFDQVTGSREKSAKFLPFVGSLFVFILLSNWMGLLPGTGSIGVWQEHHGAVELIPILRPATSDLNLTVAMALMSVIGSHLVGIAAIGFFTHLGRFIQLGGMVKAIASLKPMNIAIAFVEFFVGLLEIVAEIAKSISLSLRLFGNIFGGEVLIGVMASLVALFIPAPFVLLELIVGLVQAMVFAMLSLAYLTVQSTEPHGAH